jgi:hypothetical protein
MRSAPLGCVLQRLLNGILATLNGYEDGDQYYARLTTSLHGQQECVPKRVTGSEAQTCEAYQTAMRNCSTHCQ